LNGEYGNTLVFPKQGEHYGTTYEKLVVRWWQWAVGQPRQKSPLLDSTGVNSTQAQDGVVWFLAGTLNPDRVTRTLTIPPDVNALFFPVITFMLSTLELPDAEPDELKPIVNNAVGGVDRKQAYLDGNFPNVVPVESPDVFDIDTPDNSILSDLYGNAIGEKSGKAFADGYWVFMNLLEAGNHVVRFSGSLHYGEYEYSTDTTYNLTIQRQGQK
jgi:hypothetical protein